MVVEAEQRHDAQEAGKVDDPGADDEGVARVVDVGDPLRALAAGLRDQNLDTAGRHQRDTGDKTGDGQQRAHGADSREAQARTTAIIRLGGVRVNRRYLRATA